MRDRKYTEDVGWIIKLEQRSLEHRKLNERIALELRAKKREDKSKIIRAGV
jgi:hypothetical protein